MWKVYTLSVSKLSAPPVVRLHEEGPAPARRQRLACAVLTMGQGDDGDRVADVDGLRGKIATNACSGHALYSFCLCTLSKWRSYLDEIWRGNAATQLQSRTAAVLHLRPAQAHVLALVRRHVRLLAGLADLHVASCCAQ